MSPRSLIVHVVLALVCVGFAWRVANRDESEDERGATSTVLIDAKKDSVTKVAYHWPKGDSEVSRTGKALVVKVDRELDAKKDKKKPPKKDDKNADGGVADVADAGVPEAPPERESATFPGGKSVATSIAALEPLASKRTLGVVDAARLASMGLEKPERSLEVITAKGTVKLEIGESAYGGQGRYARIAGSDVVHLLDPSVVSGLEGGVDTLMEKRLVAADQEEVAAYDVRYGDKTASFEHIDREQSKTRKFVAKGSPSSSEGKEEAAKVMTTLRALKLTKLAEPKSAGSAVAQFRVQVADGGEFVVELLERTDGEGHLAKTPLALGEVSETSAKELLEDLGALFGD